MLTRSARRRGHAACKWVFRALTFSDDRFELPTRNDVELPDPDERNKGHATSRTPDIIVSIFVWTVMLGMIVAAWFMLQYVVVQGRRSPRVQLPLNQMQLMTLDAMAKYVEDATHPEPCVPAAMFGQHVQLVVIREKFLTYYSAVRMANPVIEPDPSNEQRISGKWPTCSGTRVREEMHAKYIVVKFVDPVTGEKRSRRFSDVDATCLLHAEEVFKGEMDTSCLRKM